CLTSASVLTSVAPVGAGAAPSAAVGYWTATSAQPVGSFGLVLGTANVSGTDKVFVLTGDGQDQIYDPASDHFTPAASATDVIKAGKSGGSAGPASSTVTALPNAGEVLHHYGGSSWYLYTYSSSGGAWIITNPSPGPYYEDSVTVLPPGGAYCGADCGKVLVVGYTGVNNSAVLHAALYDPSNNMWQPVPPPAPPITPLADQVATALPDGRVLAIAGTTAQIYNPSTNAWSPATSPGPVPLTTLGATSLVVLQNGDVLALGAYPNGYVDSNERYSPGTNRWSPVTACGCTAAGTQSLSATLLADGSVLVLDASTTGHVYDPNTDQWQPAGQRTPASDPNAIATGTRATLLGGTGCTAHCGEVLAVGGYFNSLAGTSGETAERYSDSPPKVTGISPPSGLRTGGSTVTISGEGLRGATQVTFGSTQLTCGPPPPSPYLCWPDPSPGSNRQPAIIATSPAHALSPPQVPASVDVTVTTPSGPTASTAADVFTYLPLLPQLNAVAPNCGLTAGGTSVTISGMNLTGATVNFGAAAGLNVTVTPDGKNITATSPPPSGNASGTVPVTATTPDGTSTFSAGAMFSYPCPLPAAPNDGGASSGLNGQAKASTSPGPLSSGGGGSAGGGGGGGSPPPPVPSPAPVPVVVPAHVQGPAPVQVQAPGPAQAPSPGEAAAPGMVGGSAGQGAPVPGEAGPALAPGRQVGPEGAPDYAMVRAPESRAVPGGVPLVAAGAGLVVVGGVVVGGRRRRIRPCLAVPRNARP
ncbi:MAG: IPT/TIG domain-containing protein, partial [Actinomycetota bacterium]|nr:IPT/TIG domain-containing protein [Actinomycetota bacterium]